MATATKKRQHNETFIIWVLLILVISNLTFFKELVGLNKNYYRYSNYDGTVTRHEIFSQSRTMSKYFVKNIARTKRFINKNPDKSDTVLFRLFEINPLKFWRWYEYLTNWRYRLPYANWKHIRKRRGYDLKYANGLQEF